MPQLNNPISDRTAGFEKPDTARPNPPREHRLFLWIAAVICLLSLLIFFREFPLSDFNLIAGNIGDDRFVIAILEHWRAVAHGQASFRSPNFFWPEHGVLGYSEALFLFSIPYVIAREISFDRYIAFELTLILFKAAGFGSMLWLLRDFVKIGRSAALVGAVLFTLSNLYFMSIALGHGHLTAVVFVPLLVCLCCASWRAYGYGNKTAANIYAGSFGLLLALILFTSFYIGWFSIVAGSIAIAYALLAKVFQARSVLPIREWLRVTVHRGPIFVAATSLFLIGMVPFLITYLPTLKQTGGRSFQENLIYTEHPLDLINTGPENWVWGRSLAKVTLELSHRPMVPAETEVGWPPLTLALVVAGLGIGLRQLRARRASSPARNNLRFLLAVLGACFLTCWVLSLDVGGRSLWWLVFKLIPGGSAIRVPARFNLVLNVLVVVVASIVLDGFKKRDTRVWQIAFWLAAGLLIAEQINTAATHLIRRDSERIIFSRVHRPPPVCASFFVKSPAAPDRPFFANQIDAMLIARTENLPTINGYSGWLPPGWSSLAFDADYLQNVKRWTRSKHVTSGLCALDLRDGAWAPVNFAPVPAPGLEIDFHSGGNASTYEKTGWCPTEEGGTWTSGEHSELIVKLLEVPTTDFLLTLTAHAFTPPQRPNFDEVLQVNGRRMAEWSITDREPVIEKRVRLPLALLRSGFVRIELLNGDPRSPTEFKLSTDSRKLGLAVETLTLEPAPTANPTPKL